MGYLRFKLRRSQCRDGIRRAYTRPLPDEMMRWVAAPTQRPRNGFVRLATDQIDPDSGERMGVFIAAYHLREGPVPTPEQRRRLKSLLRWFSRNLTVPREVTPRAIFWFRADAAECIENVWKLVRILQECGQNVHMMESPEPGTITYKDDLQVAAIPFSDRHAGV